MNHPLAPALLPLLAIVTVLPVGCDRRCETVSEPIAEDDPVTEDDDLTALDVVEARGSRDYDVDLFWNQDVMGFGSSPSELGVSLTPPRGEAALSLRFDGIAPDSVVREEWTGVCRGHGLAFESEVEVALGDAEPVVDPAGTVRVTTLFSPWITAELSLEALESELAIRVHSDARGDAPPRLVAWVRLRNDGQVELAGLNLVGLNVGTVELARSDARSRFRETDRADASAR